jgi:hypothetical protein
MCNNSKAASLANGSLCYIRYYQPYIRATIAAAVACFYRQAVYGSTYCPPPETLAANSTPCSKPSAVLLELT